jgi:small subunit ribosomal protein S8
MNKINVIRDLLVSLKNGYSNKNKYAYCKLNSFCISVLWQLYKEELIYDFSVEPESSKIKIKLKYFKNKPLITNLQLISKPSLVNFSNFEELRLFYKKYDYFFLSTSMGVISSRLLGKKYTTGGQVLFGLKLNTQ